MFMPLPNLDLAPVPPIPVESHTMTANCRVCKVPCDLRPRPWLNTNLESTDAQIAASILTLDDSNKLTVGAGKYDLNLLFQFTEALNEVGRVLEFGEKQKSYDWQHFTTLPLDKQRASLMRHLLGTGQHHTELDRESKLFHATHLASRALMYLQTILTTET